jgi:hypothetical protein
MRRRVSEIVVTGFPALGLQRPDDPGTSYYFGRDFSLKARDGADITVR